MIAASIDRRADVAGAYQVCDRDDAKNLVRLSAEWRLLDAAAARLLKHVETDVPQPMSQRWAKAQRAPEPGGIVPLADGDGATLVVPRLHKWLWEKRIHEFEHVPRLLASITGDTAEGLAAIRQRWVAAALERLEGLGIGSPQQRFAPPRWISEEHRRRGAPRRTVRLDSSSSAERHTPPLRCTRYR